MVDLKIQPINCLNPDFFDEGKDLMETKHLDLTRKIIGCAMKVHSKIGTGFQEVIYQRALGLQMTKENLSFVREKEMKIFYDGKEVGTRRVDFFIEGKVMVELKALTQLEPVHIAQALNYLEAYSLEVGLLINFGAKSLQFKRVHNNKPLQENPSIL